MGWTTPSRLTLTEPGIPFQLENGAALGEVDVEYETYGELNETRDNAILIAHALSGDAHVAGWDSQASENYRPWRLKHPGWWDAVIGPRKAIDTERFFVVCANVLGSCYGTTGPSSLNPATGRPYALDFPTVSIGDWVNMEKRLLEKLGVRHLYAVCGGSLGGQQALEWALAYPEWVGKCLILASGPKLSAQGIGFNSVGRHAIMHDIAFKEGNYYDGEPPAGGLAAARMLAHITYLSGQGMNSKFGRSRKAGSRGAFEAEFEIENYLAYQGRSFVRRFDANSYLYITRAMDHYDAAAKWGGGSLRQACARISSEVMLVSFSSDWLYPPADSRDFAHALLRRGIPVTYTDVDSIFGHDAFLVESAQVSRLLRAFLLSPSRSRRILPGKEAAHD